MGLRQIDGFDLARMLEAGCSFLEENKSKVDALNVFPVPDGDTGTNMFLTLTSAIKEIQKNPTGNIGAVGKALSMGSLMGARGNSGVILSQVFRGFAKELEGHEDADARLVAKALQAGSDTAYKAVMKPVEGTILTVVREAAKAALAAARTSEEIPEVLLAALEAARRTLARTPQMLPILKEAGVVDSGGQGFVYFLEGMITALTGETRAGQDYSVTNIEQTVAGGDGQDMGYCTEVLIRGSNLRIEHIRQQLEPLGESLLVVGEEDLVKVHIHSNHPGKVLETCLQWGSLHDIKIDNLEEEAAARQEMLAQDSAPAKKVGLVAVCQGDGWREILSSLGVDKQVEGGQTMNPSTEDLLNAVNEVRAEGIIILPNNKNVILAAQQAAEIASIPVRVVPTTSAMQAVAALVVYDPEAELDMVLESMTEEIARVKTGEVTVAVRDSQVNGLKISAGDHIGLVDDVVKVKADNPDDCVLGVLKEIANEGDLISIYYGAEVSEEQAVSLQSKVQEAFPDFDVEVHYGGQPFYLYQLSVE